MERDRRVYRHEILVSLVCHAARRRQTSYVVLWLQQVVESPGHLPSRSMGHSSHWHLDRDQSVILHIVLKEYDWKLHSSGFIFIIFTLLLGINMTVQLSPHTPTPSAKMHSVTDGRTDRQSTLQYLANSWDDLIKMGNYAIMLYPSKLPITIILGAQWRLVAKLIAIYCNCRESYDFPINVKALKGGQNYRSVGLRGMIEL